MIAVDTNVVVRLLVRDDQDQARRAYALFDENPIFIGATVLLETEWVLRSAYDFSSADIHDAFEKLLGLAQVTVGDPVIVRRSLDWYKQGLDFADALHLAGAQLTDGDGFATFDRALQKSAEGLASAPVILEP
jgi:predicted nucleic-acid-binding protein